MAVGDRNLQVLAWPAVRKRDENPYTYLLQQATTGHQVETSELTLRRLLLGSWDIVHIHWPEMVLLRGRALQQVIVAVALCALLFLQRLRGAEVVWTVHNLSAHETTRPALTRLYMAAFLRLLTGFIAPSESGKAAALDRYPVLAGRPSVVTGHGHYRSEYPTASEPNELRRRFGIPDSATLLVSIGQIRAYKGYTELAQTVASAPPGQVHYLVAGKPVDEGAAEALKAIADSADNVHVLLGHASGQQVADLLDAADLFAAPFRNVLHSGSVILALTFGCRVIAPALPYMNELNEAVGPGWIQMYDEDLDLATLLDLADRKPSTPQPDLTLLEWDRIGELTATFFRDLARSDGGN